LHWNPLHHSSRAVRTASIREVHPVRIKVQHPSSCWMYATSLLYIRTSLYFGCCNFSFLMFNIPWGFDNVNSLIYTLLQYNTSCTNFIRGTLWRSVWGITLQNGRSRDRFPMISLEFFIDIILSAALWPWGWLRL
jgi:hypothetical protein